ncbi:MAG: HAD family hydrolase [Candidatus Binatia bacterium]
MTAAVPKAILFDFDGVIVDSESIHHRAYDIALAAFGAGPVPFATYAEVFSNRSQGLDYIARSFPGVDVAAVKRRKDELFLELLREKGHLLPGVVDTLSALSERWPLALATGSSRAAAAIILERHGLAGRFRAVVGREDYPREKPAPDAFLRACDALGAGPDACLAVEDSYKGLTAARAGGICCVVVPNDYTRAGDFTGAAAVLASLSELSVERAEAIYCGCREAR